MTCVGHRRHYDLAPSAPITRGQWSYAVRDRLTGAPILSLCQMAAVRARTRCQMRTMTPVGVCPLCCSRSSCPLKVSLIDSMICRSGLKNWACRPFGFALAGRADQVDPGSGEGGFEVAAEVVLVRDQDLSGSVPGQGGVGENAQQHQPFIGLRPGQRRPDRQPVQGGDQV